MAFREFSGKDCKVSFLGKPAAVKSIEYGSKQDKKDSFVLGDDEPHSEIVGRKESSGEIALPQSEFEALIGSLPEDTDPLDIAPFDIVVVFVDQASSRIVTDVLENCSIKEFKKAMKDDDGMMVIPMPLRIGKIRLNVRNN